MGARRSSLGKAVVIQRILCDIADSCEMAPSFCFMADRSCCFAAVREAIARWSSTMLRGAPLKTRLEAWC